MPKKITKHEDEFLCQSNCDICKPRVFMSMPIIEDKTLKKGEWYLKANRVHANTSK